MAKQVKREMWQYREYKIANIPKKDILRVIGDSKTSQEHVKPS